MFIFHGKVHCDGNYEASGRALETDFAMLVQLKGSVKAQSFNLSKGQGLSDQVV